MAPGRRRAHGQGERTPQVLIVGDKQAFINSMNQAIAKVTLTIRRYLESRGVF